MRTRPSSVFERYPSFNGHLDRFALVNYVTIHNTGDRSDNNGRVSACENTAERARVSIGLGGVLVHIAVAARACVRHGVQVSILEQTPQFLEFAAHVVPGFCDVADCQP